MRIFKRFLLTAAFLFVAVAALAGYLVRGGFRRFEIAPYPVSPAAFTNWNDVLAHPRDISLTTLQTGVVHMDACLNLDPASPKQADCDHVPRDLAVLVHWIRHPWFGIRRGPLRLCRSGTTARLRESLSGHKAHLR